MRIYVPIIMLTILNCIALNAAAKCASAAATQELFALYHPSCTAYSKSTIGIRGGINEKSKQLTLTLTQDDQPISDTVILYKNKVYIQRNDGTLPHRFRWDGEHIKLSFVARTQYKGIIPHKSKPLDEPCNLIISSASKTVYICGKFLIIHKAHDARLRVPPTISSVTGVIKCLKSAHTSDPFRASHPLIVVDINQHLINCFGPDWEHKLPVL